MPLSEQNTDGISDFSHSAKYQSYERQQERIYLLHKQKETRDATKLMTSSEYSTDNSDDNEQEQTLTGKQTKEASTSRKVIVMMACLYLHVCAFGMVVALGVIYVELIPAFNSTRADAALVQSLYMGTAVGGGVLFTGIIKKYRLGDYVIVASSVATAAFLASAFGNSLEITIVLVGVIAGLAVGLNVLCSFVVVSWTFSGRRKMALGILTLGATIGQILMPIIANSLIQAYYWDGALLVMSALLTFNCVPCGLILHYSEEFFDKGIDLKGKGGSKWIDCLKDVPFIVFLVVTIVFAATAPIEQLFSVDLSVSRGYSRQSGSILLSINGIFGFIGRIIGTVILTFRPNTRPEIHLAYSFFTWGIAHFLIIQFAGYWEMALSMTLRGLAAGLSVAFLPSIQIELRGRENYPQTVAVCNFLNGVGQALGGFLGGFSVDVTGSYDLGFYIAAACSVLCALSFVALYLMTKLPKPNTLGDTHTIKYEKL